MAVMLTTVVAMLFAVGVRGLDEATRRSLSGLERWKARREAPFQDHLARGDQLPGPQEHAGTSLRQLRQAEVKRPYRLAHYSGIEATDRTQKEIDYLMEKLMPATSYVIGRSVRVRDPEGPINVGDYTDYEGEPIPVPPEGAFALPKPPVRPEPPGCVPLYTKRARAGHHGCCAVPVRVGWRNPRTAAP